MDFCSVFCVHGVLRVSLFYRFPHSFLFLKFIHIAVKFCIWRRGTVPPALSMFFKKEESVFRIPFTLFFTQQVSYERENLCLCTCERAHIQGKVFLNNLDYWVPHRAKQTAGNWLGSDWYVDWSGSSTFLHTKSPCLLIREAITTLKDAILSNLECHVYFIVLCKWFPVAPCGTLIFYILTGCIKTTQKRKHTSQPPWALWHFCSSHFHLQIASHFLWLSFPWWGRREADISAGLWKRTKTTANSFVLVYPLKPSLIYSQVLAGHEMCSGQIANHPLLTSSGLSGICETEMGTPSHYEVPSQPVDFFLHVKGSSNHRDKMCRWSGIGSYHTCWTCFDGKAACMVGGV